jgi:ATP-dependent RNA/DNA helicase IGHMBP2
MNEEQAKAVKMGLKQQVHLIHGPPGTGKTTTVCELIVQAVKKGEKVLACAPSNIAVDNIIESIGKRVKCVRIGNPARVIDSILEHCLDSLITKHTNIWKNEVKKLQATRKRLSKSTSR